MKIFIIGTGSELEVPIRLAREGHNVIYWVYKKGRADFDELLRLNRVNYQKTEQPNIPSDVDFVVYVDVMAPSLVDKLKKSYKVFGPPSPIAKLELDRSIGKKIAKAAGIPIPEYFTANARTAYQKIKKEKKAYVVKPYNNLPVWFTNIPYSYEDSLGVLDEMISRYNNPTVICERRIFGAEIGIETFFDGEDFFEPFNLGFEFKRAYDGDQGPLTGEMGSFMYYGYTNLAEFLKRLKQVLQKFDYHGDVTMGLIVEEETGIPYFLEWTYRFGFPWIVFQSDLWNIELGELLWRVVNPQPDKTIKVNDLFLNAIRYLAPGGEYFDAFNKHGKSKPITGLDKFVNGIPVLERVRFEHVEYSEGRFYTGTYSPYAIVVVGYGYRGYEAIEDSYQFIRPIKINEGYYRTDIGERVVRKDIAILSIYNYVDEDHFRRCYAPEFCLKKVW